MHQKWPILSDLFILDFFAKLHLLVFIALHMHSFVKLKLLFSNHHFSQKFIRSQETYLTISVIILCSRALHKRRSYITNLSVIAFSISLYIFFLNLRARRKSDLVQCIIGGVILNVRTLLVVPVFDYDFKLMPRF